MLTPMGRVLSTELDPPTNTGTEYRECFLSPRREDYGPRAVIPKAPVKRSLSNRSALSIDLETNPLSDSSEYRLCFENYHPKRPYIYHQQRSQVFDYVPKPLQRKLTTKLPLNSNGLHDTEYHERFPNYRSFMATQELRPAHIPDRAETLSITQRQKEQNGRSQYFQQLVADHERSNGGQRHIGTTEQRNAFQWPFHLSQIQRTPRPVEAPTPAPQPYYTPRNIYEPLPPIQRTTVNTLE